MDTSSDEEFEDLVTCWVFGNNFEKEIPSEESTAIQFRFGVGCGRRELPGVYTRVSSFVNWIKSITRS